MDKICFQLIVTEQTATAMGKPILLANISNVVLLANPQQQVRVHRISKAERGISVISSSTPKRCDVFVMFGECQIADL